VVPKAMCDALVRAINHYTGLEFLEQTQARDKVQSPDAPEKERKTHHVGNYFPALKHSPLVMNLLEQTASYSLVESLIGEGNVVKPHGAQLALRHPTTDLDPVATLVQQNASPIFNSFSNEEYHIDGKSKYGQRTGPINNFTLLVGIFLKDVSEPNSGNFVVYPGTHITHAQKFKEVGPQSFFQEPTMPKWFAYNPALPRPRQITGKAGDILIAHYLLGHTVAPNSSPDVRYKIYFRVQSKHLKQHQLKSMTEPWLDWPGITPLLSKQE